jgi:hypothetical protein
MFCSSKHWRVSNKRIDLDYSCCRNKTAIIDMRRVKVSGGVSAGISTSSSGSLLFIP